MASVDRSVDRTQPLRRPEPPYPAPPGERWYRWSNGRSSGWKLEREPVPLSPEERAAREARVAALPYTPIGNDRFYGGPHPLTVTDMLGDEEDHVPRPHKKGYPVDVCAYCSSIGGDGDGLDGSYVAWPCEILAFLQARREPEERPDGPTTATVVASLRELERWTSDPRAREACGRLLAHLERGGRP